MTVIWCIGLTGPGGKRVMNGTVFKDAAFKDIEKLEADLWEAADELRANSKLTSSDYFMPVLGILFLRHAANRFETVARVAADHVAGRIAKRRPTDADVIRPQALPLLEWARYGWIMEQVAGRKKDLQP